jgi:predicted RNA-binding protein (virulence factor B family)
MHPFNHPDTNLDGLPIDVRVSKDILIPLEHLKALRYVQKDEQGRVRKVLFEPDQDERVRGQIDKLLDKIAREKWGDAQS